MLKKFTYLLAFFLFANLSFAQGLIPERLLLSSGQNIGTGARALGLGGTFTGIGDDFSSVWWNPAGIVQVKRIEMQGSLARSGYSNETSYFGSPWDGKTSGTRLNNAGMVFPVPVYQGGLSFAFGYNQLLGYDRRTRIRSSQIGSQYWDKFDELETGRLGIWSLAGAMDVSPNLALGVSVNYWSGVNDYSFTGTYTDSLSTYTQNSLGTDLSGWNFGFGGLLRVGRYARIGGLLQTPVIMKMKEEWTQDDNSGHFDYRMTYPSILRAGASFSPGRWLLAADIEYRDWTSLQFRTDTPYSGVTKAEANQQIKDSYDGTTRLSFGGEYLFPMYGLRARAGYSFEPSNYRDAGSDADRNNISFGVGVLVDRSVMLDATYQIGNYTENITNGLTEDVKNSVGLFTLSYRL